MSKAMFLAPLEAREAARADAARAAAPVPPGGLSKLLGARRRATIDGSRRRATVESVQIDRAKP